MKNIDFFKVAIFKYYLKQYNDKQVASNFTKFFLLSDESYQRSKLENMITDNIFDIAFYIYLAASNTRKVSDKLVIDWLLSTTRQYETEPYAKEKLFILATMAEIFSLLDNSKQQEYYLDYLKVKLIPASAYFNIGPHDYMKVGEISSFISFCIDKACIQNNSPINDYVNSLSLNIAIDFIRNYSKLINLKIESTLKVFSTLYPVYKKDFDLSLTLHISIFYIIYNRIKPLKKQQFRLFSPLKEIKMFI